MIKQINKINDITIPKPMDSGCFDRCSPVLVFAYACVRILRKIKERESELRDVKELLEELAKKGESIEKYIEYIASKFLKVIEDDVETLLKHVKNMKHK